LVLWMLPFEKPMEDLKNNLNRNVCGRKVTYICGEDE
jgi:hypothetical protein